MKSPTNKQIAESFELWSEYFDTGAQMSRQEFDNLTIKERLEMLNDIFPKGF